MSLSRRTFCLKLAIALTAGGLVSGARAKGNGDDKGNGRRSRNDKTGVYVLEVRGYLKGSGTATVTAAGISIDANVTDEAGRRTQLKLDATSSKLSKDRFTGTGKAFGQNVSINGRIDPPTGAIKVTRITATYGTANGRFGRISGQKK